MSAGVPPTAESFQTKLKAQLSHIDGRFAHVKILDQFEQKTKLPRSYAILGCAGLYLFMTFLNIGGIGQLLSNIAGFVVPGYLSLKALRTATKQDDEDLLIYWIVFSVLNIIEFWSSSILYFVPFYWFLKTIFLVYISVPQFGGARFVYYSFLKPSTDRYLFASKPAEKVN